MTTDPTSTQGGPPVDSRPVPDPTSLTTEALQREVAQLRELIESRLEALTDLTHEKITSLVARLDSVETLRLEQKADTKANVEAALTAQKEQVKEQVIASERSIAKSEAATNKQLEQLGTTFATAFDGIRRDIDGLKERIGGAEQQKVGSHEASTGIYAFAGFFLVLLTIGAIITAAVK